MELNAMSKRTDTLTKHLMEVCPSPFLELIAIQLSPNKKPLLPLSWEWWSTVGSLVSLFTVLNMSRVPAYLLLRPSLFTQARSGLLSPVVDVILWWEAEIGYFLPQLHRLIVSILRSVEFCGLVSSGAGTRLQCLLVFKLLILFMI